MSPSWLWTVVRAGIDKWAEVSPENRFLGMSYWERHCCQWSRSLAQLPELWPFPFLSFHQTCFHISHALFLPYTRYQLPPPPGPQASGDIHLHYSIRLVFFISNLPISCFWNNSASLFLSLWSQGAEKYWRKLQTMAFNSNHQSLEQFLSLLSFLNLGNHTSYWNWNPEGSAPDLSFLLFVCN